MGLENNKWRVVKGDCLWNIAKSVYKNPYRWTEIAKANGLATSGNPIIYPKQLLILPGITPGSSSTSAEPAAKPTTSAVNIDWYALRAGTERDMECFWSWSKSPNKYWVRWEAWDSNNRKTIVSDQSSYDASNITPNSRQSFDDLDAGARISIRPVKDECDGNINNEKNFQDNTKWAIKDYYFKNNPPKLPPTPSLSINSKNKVTITIENIDKDINGNQIEIAIYKNDTTKYKTATVSINTDTHFAKYEQTVDAGQTYKARCRAKRGNIYGGWTEFSNSDQSVPNAPKQITQLYPKSIMDQQETQYNVYIEWSNENTASHYVIEYTTNPAYFDTSGNVTRVETEDGQGPKYLITGIEVGHQYYFRVASINDKGQSVGWTPIKSLSFGTKPAQPTTWSNTISAIVGENLNLYWTHNATDGSRETYARLHFTLTDSSDPSASPITKTITVPNSHEASDTSNTFVYTINTSDSQWSLLSEGYSIEWKVQTAGIASEYSDYSIVRKVNVYTKPELVLDVQNKDGASVSEINEFPFYFDLSASPYSQTPISYYIEVVANEGYETIDDYGNVKTINIGDKVYQKYFDPDSDSWELKAEMTPGLIDLENNIDYTVTATVSMNSGLTAEATATYKAYVSDTYYDIDADVVINYETLEATIHPYCLENNYEYTLTAEEPSDWSTNWTNYYTKLNDIYMPVTDETSPTWAADTYYSRSEIQTEYTANCTLSVYRKEYDGSFTQIADDIENVENLYVTDPHPALDYARYRVVARTSDTGAISYRDIDSVKVGVTSAVIQWAEKWNSFITDSTGDEEVEPAWSGSMLKLPYNIDISVSNGIDVSLVEYVGRQHPVSYYGTQLGEQFSWNMEIPADDVETLYGIRRLAAWTDNVYVRDPSGIGYWASITVNYNKNHGEVTIPVSFNITRVEGGM